MSGEVLDVRLGCMKLHVLAQCCLKLHSFELSGRAGVTKAVPGEGPANLQLMGLARIAAMRVVPGGVLAVTSPWVAAGLSEPKRRTRS